MRPVAPLSLPIKASRRLLLVQLVAHIVAVAAVISSATQSGLAAFLLLLVGYSWLRVHRSSPVTGLVLRGDGTIETIGSDGAVAGAVLHHHTLVLSYLVVLLYRQNDRLRALTLLRDNLSAEDFRQLRLWLRWRGSTRPAETTA
jgi:hypothetical protein